MATVHYAKIGYFMDNQTDKNDYTNYREFKGWGVFFNPTGAEIRQLDYELRDIPIREGMSLLDVGFGNGALLKWASKKKVHIAGIELNEDLILEAKKSDIKLYSSLIFVESKEFNVVTFMDVFEHLEIAEINQALMEARRILKDGGFLVARFPNCQSPGGLVEQFGDHTHKTMLSAPIFISMARKYGFKIISVASALPLSEFPADKKNRISVVVKNVLRTIIQFIYRLGFGTGNTFLSPSIIIVAN